MVLNANQSIKIFFVVDLVLKIYYNEQNKGS